jgi:chromosome segregation ATPase
MKNQILLTFGLSMLLAGATQAGQEQLAASIKDARSEATMTSSQLNATLAALNTLVGQEKGDLRPAYEAFQAEIPKTQSAAATTAARVQSMSSDSDKYFGDWQKTVNDISNTSVQKKAQKRLNKARESYNKVETSLKAAGDKFRPFLSDLTDVQKALSQDVTSGGVKAVKPIVRSANWNYKGVLGSISQALREMDKMEKALSGEAA